MFLAIELHTCGVYVSIYIHCLFMPSKLVMRVRKIALRGEHDLLRYFKFDGNVL